MTTASSPIYNEKDEFIGASGVDITLDVIGRDILSRIPSCHKLDGLFSFLVDDTGRFIAFPSGFLDRFAIKIDKEKIKEASSIFEHKITESTIPSIRKIGQAMLDNQYHVSEFSLSSEKYIFSSHIMPSTKWRLGIAVPESSILASIYESRKVLNETISGLSRELTLMSAAFLFLAIFTSIVLSIRFFINPLIKLSQGAMKVKNGDLNVQVDIRSKNEFGELAAIFNDMVAHLRLARKREMEHTERLEVKVKKRTLELREKNKKQQTILEHLRQEISARKAIEKDLRISQAKLSNIVENSTNLFYSHTIDNEIVYISPQCRDYLQCDPHEAMVDWTQFTTDNPINAEGERNTQKSR